MQLIDVYAENFEDFLDKYTQAVKHGYERTNSLDLQMAIMTNFWRVEMELVDGVEDGDLIEDEEPVSATIDEVEGKSKRGVKKSKE